MDGHSYINSRGNFAQEDIYFFICAAFSFIKSTALAAFSNTKKKRHLKSTKCRSPIQKLSQMRAQQFKQKTADHFHHKRNYPKNIFGKIFLMSSK